MTDTNSKKSPIDTGYPVDAQGNRIYLLEGPRLPVGKQADSNGGKMLGGITGKGFMPGRSGNPKGRAKRKTITEAIYEVLMKAIPPELAAKRPDLKDKPMMELFAEVGVRKAIAGDVRFWAEILRKVDGEKAEGILSLAFNTQNNVNVKVDLGALSVEELRQYHALIAKLAGRNGPAA